MSALAFLLSFAFLTSPFICAPQEVSVLHFLASFFSPESSLHMHIPVGKWTLTQFSFTVTDLALHLHAQSVSDPHL